MATKKELEEQVEALEADKVELGAATIDLLSQVDDLQAGKAELAAVVSSLNAEVDILKRNKTDLAYKISELAKKSKQLEIDLYNALSAEVAAPSLDGDYAVVGGETYKILEADVAAAMYEKVQKKFVYERQLCCVIDNTEEA